MTLDTPYDRRPLEIYVSSKHDDTFEIRELSFCDTYVPLGRSRTFSIFPISTLPALGAPPNLRQKAVPGDGHDDATTMIFFGQSRGCHAACHICLSYSPDTTM